MSITSKVSTMATAIGTQLKTVKDSIGDLTSLSTTEKGTVVGAVNEIKTAVDNAAANGGAAINDATTSTSEVWSSNKTNNEIVASVASVVDSSPAALDTLNELAAALGDDANFAATTATALGNRLRFDAAQTLSGPEQTQGLTNLGAASQADMTQAQTDIGDESTFDPSSDFTTALNA